MTRRGLAALAAIAIAGAAAGYLAAPAPAKPAPSGALVQAPVTHVEALDREALRALLREELAALHVAIGEPAPVVVTPERAAPALEREPPTPEQDENHVVGRALLDDALARRSWTPEDAGRLRVVLASVSPEQRRELIRELIPALNEGRLQPTFSGPPF